MLKIKSIHIPGLDSVSLQVNRGQSIGLSGASGCGKTRLLRAIADLDEHSGEVCLDDTCWRDVPAHVWRKRVAYLPAESQWWHDVVQEHFTDGNIAYQALGFPADVNNWQIARCSSGEKQRLAVLRILQNKPEVLLLDEPTANLDPHNTTKVEQLLTQYIDQEQALAIWVSHDQQQLRRLCNQCYDLSSGRLQQSWGVE